MIKPRAHHRRGFTLIELLVVIGIIVVLMALAVPALIRARTTAKKATTALTMQSISTALTAWEQDNNQSLPPAYESTLASYPPTPATQVHVTPGFAALCFYLIGPGGAVKPSGKLYVSGAEYHAGDCVYTPPASEFVCFRDFPGTNPPTDANYWMPINLTDGHSGPGRAGAKVVGPYLQPESVKHRDGAILDAWDHPIAYFPARKAKNNIRLPNVAPPPPANPATGLDPFTKLRPGYYCDQSTLSQYNSWDNLLLFIHPASPWNETPGDAAKQKIAQNRIRMMLGDTGDSANLPNGYIDGGESPVTDEPYLLWSAGPDGNFGPSLDPAKVRSPAQEVSRCDDVMNFR